MKAAEIVSSTEKLVLPVLEGYGYSLYDIEFVKEGQNWILRIYIDKDGGIGISDCENVSRAVDKLLDEHDFIEKSYMLEVSSPGINRQLKKDSDYERYKSEMVTIKLYSAVNNKKEYTGRLECLADGIVTITDEAGNEINFKRKDIASCRLYVDFS